ncbi:MAG: TolC family protein, partial [Thermoanaerobaculia bacterium]
MIATRYLALSAVLLLAAPPAPGAGPLTLAEAQRLAAERSPDLLAARADLSAADAQRAATAQLPNPTLSWLTAKIPTDGTPASTDLGNGFFDRSYDTIVALNQLVEIGGKRSARKRSGAEGYAAAEARLLDVERLLPAAVVRAYSAALVARGSAALARESSESFRRTASLAAAREEAGQISKVDRLQVEIAAARFEADAVLAEAGATVALLALEGTLGLPADTSLALADSLERISGDVGTIPSPAGDDAAVVARSDVRAFEFALRRAEADRDLAKA